MAATKRNPTAGRKPADAAEGGNLGTNTSAAETAEQADVSSPAVSAAGESTHASEAGATHEGKEIAPAGGLEEADVFEPTHLHVTAEPTHLHITALRPDGFRRGGRHWPAGAGDVVSLDTLSDEQLDAVLCEPLLRCVFIADQDAE